MNSKIQSYIDQIANGLTDEAIDELMEYGDGYTSRTIHTINGFGYVVCEDCYDKERKEELAYEQD